MTAQIAKQNTTEWRKYTWADRAALKLCCGAEMGREGLRGTMPATARLRARSMKGKQSRWCRQAEKPGEKVVNWRSLLLHLFPPDGFISGLCSYKREPNHLSWVSLFIFPSASRWSMGCSATWGEFVRFVLCASDACFQGETTTRNAFL